MEIDLQFEPLITELYTTYIEIGTTAYNQHYRHLWPNGDTSTYIENSFTDKVLKQEEKDTNTSLYLIKVKNSYTGILKITFDKAVDKYSALESLYVDKIYIQKEYTGQGIGKKTIEFVINLAKKRLKKVVYLEAMKKGPALPFYIANNFTIVGTTEVPFPNAINEEKPMFMLLREI